MGYLIKIDGSPFWQARFPGKSGVEIQRSTKTRDRRQAEAILAGWALQAHLDRQPGLCQARVRRISAEMARLVGGDTTPVATYQAARDAFLARSKAMGHETCINRRSALKGFDVYLDQIGSAGGAGSPREREVMGLMVAGLLNKQIAVEPGTALATIKIQRAGLRLI